VNFQALNNMSNQQQQHFKLGERGYHVFANEYQGEPKIHIRKIYQEPVEGKSIITKYGITLSLDE